MNKLFTLFATLCLISASAFSQSFKVSYGDKSYQFPLESEITISSEEGLTDVTTLVEPVTTSNTEQYFAAAQIVVMRADTVFQTIDLAPVGDWTFQGSTNSLEVDDAIYVQYRRGTSTMWTSLSAKYNKWNNYPLCQSNRLQMGNRNLMKVTKAPNVTFGSDNALVTFTLMGCNGTPTLLATGFAVETALVDTVERSFNTRYVKKKPVLHYTTGNSVKQTNCTLYNDSVWVVDVNPFVMTNSYFSVLPSDNSSTTVNARLASYSGYSVMQTAGSGEYNELPANLNKSLKVTFNENTLETFVSGYVDPANIKAPESVEGTWYYAGSELFTVKDGKLTFSSSYGLEQSTFDIEVSDDKQTFTIHPAMAEGEYGKKWIMMGRRDDGYITNFNLATKDDVFAALKDATFSVSDGGIVCDDGFQFVIYSVASETATWFTQKGSGIIKAGSILYKE